MSTGGNFADATGGGLFRIKVKMVISTARAPTAPSAISADRRQPCPPSRYRAIGNPGGGVDGVVGIVEIRIAGRVAVRPTMAGNRLRPQPQPTVQETRYLLGSHEATVKSTADAHPRAGTGQASGCG